MPSNGFPRHLPNLLSPYLAGFPVKQSPGDSSISARLCKRRKQEEDESGLGTWGRHVCRPEVSGTCHLEYVEEDPSRRVRVFERQLPFEHCLLLFISFLPSVICHAGVCCLPFACGLLLASRKMNKPGGSSIATDYSNPSSVLGACVDRLGYCVRPLEELAGIWGYTIS